jgi:hypothetical protein
MAILMGPDFVVKMANTRQMAMWDKQVEEVIDNPLFDIFPEVQSQEFKDLLTDVYNTGKPYVGKEMAAHFFRNGQYETAYFNFTYEPFRDNSGEVIGVTVVSIEVTDLVLYRNEPLRSRPLPQN